MKAGDKVICIKDIKDFVKDKQYEIIHIIDNYINIRLEKNSSAGFLLDDDGCNGNFYIFFITQEELRKRKLESL